jgi:hypothetical protein
VNIWQERLVVIGLAGAATYLATIVAVLLHGGPNALLYVALLLLVPADLSLIAVTATIRRRRR